MKQYLKQLYNYEVLTREQAKEIMLNLASEQYNQEEITSMLTVYLMRSITIDELQGFRDGLLELAVRVNLEGYQFIDIVGTGGDGKNTFNISTLACFVVAGTGVKVAKHGNYGSTSMSGSSNVMEQLGYRFKANTDRLKKEMEEANITFLHAPLFHPALKAVARIRKNLGFRTLFNMLGPLVNPASPGYQMIGVFNLEMARIYNYLLQQSGKPFTIIHGLDGYDEISLTGDTKVITRDGEQVFSAQKLGKRNFSPADLNGGYTVEEAARIFMNILKGNGTWAQVSVSIANAAMAMYGAGYYPNYDDAFSAAEESLESGKALTQFQNLISIQ